MLRAGAVAAAAALQIEMNDETADLRGLVISDDDFQAAVAGDPLSAWWNAPEVPPESPFAFTFPYDAPLTAIARAFDLRLLDVAILLLCAAPEIDRRYERIYGYLQDDVTLRRPSAQLLVNLFQLGNAASMSLVVSRLMPTAPLVAHRLLETNGDGARAQAGYLNTPLRVDARTVQFLLGERHTPDQRLRSAVWYEAFSAADARPPHPTFDPLRATLSNGVPPLIALDGADAATRRLETAAFCASIGLPLMCIDLPALVSLDLSFEQAWQLALREAYWGESAVLIQGWDAAFRAPTPANEEGFIEYRGVEPPRAFWSGLMGCPRPIFLCDLGGWEPRDLTRQRRLLRLVLPVLRFEQRREMWAAHLAAYGVRVSNAEIDEIASKYKFTTAQIARAVDTSADYAASRIEGGSDEISHLDLAAGARTQAALRLEGLAQRITPRMAWDDLILPPDELTQLREITNRARYNHIVAEKWGFAGKMSNVGRISVLFAGESGTGKTLAAEVIAHDLEFDLFKIELSAVVSKYIGETEKNLDRIFKAAEDANAVLFFDEADALFGKRSEVKDARDRYANIEIAYLLQKIENYDGIAILATNLRQNLDDAFTRRLDFLVDFPFPEPEYRLRLWTLHFPADAPLAPNVDLRHFADSYRLAGGNIRNAALAAGFLAAADPRSNGLITNEHITAAIRRENQKMGRLLDG